MAPILSIRLLAGIGFAVAVSTIGDAALAQPSPVPPCQGQTYPAAGEIGDSLKQLVWIDEEVPADWAPPACTGWPAGPIRALLAGAGSFRMAGDTGALVAHLAEISRLRDIVYWSTSRKSWRPLFDEAAALSLPDRDAVRADFSKEDVVPGAVLLSWLKENNPTAGVVYRTTVHERTPDRLVFETVNVSSVKARLLVFTREIAGPGEFRQLYFIERERDDVWSFYSLSLMGRSASLAGTTAANYRNRAEAYFRYLAELDMEREPPASP